MREQINPIPQRLPSLQKPDFQTMVEKSLAGSIEPEGEINEEDFANAKNKDAGFRGAGDVIRLIEELLTFERVLTDEIEFYEQVVMGILKQLRTIPEQPEEPLMLIFYSTPLFRSHRQRVIKRQSNAAKCMVTF